MPKNKPAPTPPSTPIKSCPKHPGVQTTGTCPLCALGRR
ncbi:OCTOPUS family protein [Planomonospora sp. ID82291]|nr:OCTOPUS family protein [Planomonospora sp. ID82291]